MKSIILSYEDYLDHRGGYDGYCTECNGITRYGSTEPDAENYECHECGEMTAMGIEMAMVSGHIEVDFGDEEEEEAV